MELWQLWCLIGITFFIVEMFTPTTFFLNLGLACLVSALVGYFGANFTVQVIIFTIFAAVFLLWLRPYLIKKKNGTSDEGEEKYIEKTAIVTEKITPSSGRIAIYGETWKAKTINGEEIDVNEQVKIVKIESIIMYVEKT